MRVLRTPSEFVAGTNPVQAAIGVFDGVHLGHAQIIGQTVAAARQSRGRSLVITFDRHPNSIVSPDRVPPWIYPLSKRLEVIESLGVDLLWLITFDEAFSRTPGRGFIEQVCDGFKPLQNVFVGGDFQFGHRRSGNVGVLREVGTLRGFETHPTPPIVHDDATVSSTRIRECVQAGDLDGASALLGRPYTITGRVLRGDQLGRTLGFPTANLDVQGLAVPPTGVYAVEVRTETARLPGVLNIGFRPTVKGAARELRCEAHLLDFNGDLYGSELELDLVAKLREEQTFPGLSALTAQIRADVAAARGLFQDLRSGL